MAEESKPEEPTKWEGTTRVALKGVKVEQVWPLLEDFCNLHKIFPSIDTCYYLEGDLGKPGMMRYCAATTSSLGGSLDDDEKTSTTTKWCKEKLLSINPIERSLSYEVLENNVGFKSYVSTIKVLSNEDIKVASNGAGGGEVDEGQGCLLERSFVSDPIEGQGCLLEWSFVSDPIEGWRVEDFAAYIHGSLQSIALKIEEILLQVQLT